MDTGINKRSPEISWPCFFPQQTDSFLFTPVYNSVNFLLRNRTKSKTKKVTLQRKFSLGIKIVLTMVICYQSTF
jgi:hypothetical protein